MTELSTHSLAALGGAVSVPGYDRTELRIGIVHFGVGGFHRAHQARYLDLLHELGAAKDWGICGVGVLAGDRQMRDVLAAQDGLYTLCVTEPAGGWDPRVVGSLVEYHYAPDDPEAVIERLAAADTRIVSLTITEGGYNINAGTGEFDTANAAVVADLAPDAVPATVFGLVTAGLARRRARGLAPFTIMSCDNIEGNGHVARTAFTTFARLRDPELADWISREGAFPNSMVDRITPVTTPTVTATLADGFGVDDAWPVLTEGFTQWVLEDTFTLGRPDFGRVGVQLVDDVAPYELMKLRLLNGSHQALCYLGRLAGYHLVHEVVEDPVFARFLFRYMAREAMPTLQPVPGINLAEYQRTLLARFGNAAIGDTVARLCAESSDRIPKWLLPVLRSQLASDGDIDCVAMVIAGWARYCEGVDEDGVPIEVVDRLRDQLMEAAARQRSDSLAFLADRSVFGDLIDNPRFVAAYRKSMESLRAHGARATVAVLVPEGAEHPHSTGP